MAVWPFGRRRQRRAGGNSNSGSGSGGLSGAALSSGAADDGAGAPPPLGGLVALPGPIGEFLSTAPEGVARLAGELGDIQVNLPSPPSAREINALVLNAYKKILETETGRRLAETAHAQERAAEDVLFLPLFLVEDVVRQRLRSTLARNWARYAVIVCTRATAATAAVRALKAAAKYLLRRLRAPPRVCKGVEVALDVLLPTELYGALAAVGLIVAQLHGELSEIRPHQQQGGGGGGGGGGGSDGGSSSEQAAGAEAPG